MTKQYLVESRHLARANQGAGIEDCRSIRRANWLYTAVPTLEKVQIHTGLGVCAVEMSLQSKPSGALGIAVGQLEVRPAPGCIKYASAADLAGGRHYEE